MAISEVFASVKQDALTAQITQLLTALTQGKLQRL